MTSDMKTMLRGILEDLAKIQYIRPEDIPNIDLYMDQVTSFMDEHLASSKRYEADKVLTKTMINNYAKNNLLPPPVKKKYSREHVIVMIFIYYFKNILSIKDIETLLEPLTDRFFGGKDALSITDIYQEVLELEKSRIRTVAKDIARAYRDALGTFSDVPEEEQDQLQMFSFLCSLCFDVYVKKLLMQKLIDQFARQQAADETSKKSEKKKK